MFFQKNAASSKLVAAAMLLICSACESPDIFVDSIEVNQAFQTSTNSIDLVSDRGTAVRVRVGVDGGGAANGVSGQLHVLVDGAPVTPVAGIAAINAPFNAPDAATWDRDTESHTLNFEIPALSGISPSADVDITVDLDPLVGEPDVSNNSGSLTNITAVSRISPKLFFTRINYTPAGAGLPALADVQPGVGDLFVKGIFPVNDADASLYQAGIFPSLTWNQDGNSNGTVDIGGEVSDLLDWLESCRQLIVDADGGSGDDIFLYGWIAGNPIDGNGWANTGGRVAFGNTQHSRHQRTYAHELGHNFGLSHNTRTLSPDAGWDTGARLDGNPATNNTTGRVKPGPLNDIMRGGQLTNSAWVDETTYEYFLGHSVLSPDSDSQGDKLYASRMLVVSGVLSIDGTELVRLNPAFRYTWLSQPSLPFLGGAYIAEAIDDQGTSWNVPFSGILGDDADTEKDTYGFFSVRIPVPEQRTVVGVSIRRLDGSVMGEMGRTKPPTLSLDTIPVGSTLEGVVTLGFEVADPDTPLDQIRVQFAYSPDAGATWVPIAVNVPGTATSIQFNVEEVASTLEDGQGVIRAYASDGLNTVMAQTRGFTVKVGQ